MTVMKEPEAPGVGATADFTARLFDHFFQRALLYLLPIALFAALGVYTASSQRSEFASEGRLTASANPLVEPTEIRTTELNRGEGPAEGSARLINEQLNTDAFIDDVAERSGLAEALSTGVIARGTIRQSVSATARGQNVFSVQASWGDPQTAFLLVQSSIDAYLGYIDEVLTGDSADAVNFLESQLDDAEGRVTAAENELETFVRGLPPLTTGERPVEVSLELNRLSDSVQEAQGVVAETERQIDAAELSVVQSQSAAGRQLRIVDAPVPALEAESALLQRLITVVVFAVMGLLLSLTVLVLATVFDRTVRSQRQLSQVAGCDVVVSIPRLNRGRRSKRTRREPPNARKAA